MNNSALLEQTRRGLKVVIDLGRETFKISRGSRVSDGFGGFMPGPPSNVTVSGRISHESRGQFVLGSVASGLDTNFSLFLLSQDEIMENDTFTVRGRKWRLGPVDALIRYGGVIGYQAKMIEG